MPAARADDLYAVLGVPAGASREDLRRAYRAIAKECHPDRSVGKGAKARAADERRFKQAAEAWGVLGDEAKRAAYDQMRSEGAWESWRRRAAEMTRAAKEETAARARARREQVAREQAERRARTWAQQGASRSPPPPPHSPPPLERDGFGPWRGFDWQKASAALSLAVYGRDALAGVRLRDGEAVAEALGKIGEAWDRASGGGNRRLSEEEIAVLQAIARML